jgi:hypothetical protein
MTLEEMASTIRNDVGSGLKEVANFNYSLDQIKDEISNVRSSIILETSKAGTLNHSYFSQRRDNVKLSSDVFPENGYRESNQFVLKAFIPKLAMTKDNSSVLYIGPADMSLNLKLYYDYTDVKNHKHSRVIKNRPFAFIDLAQDGNGNLPVYVFNTGPASFKLMSVRAIFDDPVRLLREDGIFPDDEEFPAPLAVQKMIMDRLTMKYIKFYKQLSGPNEPNDQTDKT